MIECSGQSVGVVIVPPMARAQVIACLRVGMVEGYRECILAEKDQGKVFGVSSRNKISKHFLQGGGEVHTLHGLARYTSGEAQRPTP
jgi:hypothetical protein